MSETSKAFLLAISGIVAFGAAILVMGGDVYQGRRQTILATREEVKQKTRQLRRQYYRAAGAQASDQSLH